jgi:TPR repeat protein
LATAAVPPAAGVAAWPSPCKAELRADEKARTCIRPDATRTFLCDASFYEECRAQCQKGSARSCWNAAANRRGPWSRGQKNRDEDAAAFLERACKGGFQPACAELGYMFGRPGSKQDKDRARALLEKACDTKDAPACTYLAGFLRGASGGWSYDPRAAGAFYERACDMGAFSACFSGAAALATDVEGAYQDPARAQHLLDEACKHKDRRACRILQALRPPPRP